MHRAMMFSQSSTKKRDFAGNRTYLDLVACSATSVSPFIFPQEDLLFGVPSKLKQLSGFTLCSRIGRDYCKRVYAILTLLASRLLNVHQTWKINKQDPKSLFATETNWHNTIVRVKLRQANQTIFSTTSTSRRRVSNCHFSDLYFNSSTIHQFRSSLLYSGNLFSAYTIYMLVSKSTPVQFKRRTSSQSVARQAVKHTTFYIHHIAPS